jgi:hypothetical protein
MLFDAWVYIVGTAARRLRQVGYVVLNERWQ